MHALVGLDAVTGVVKVVGFVASAPGFTGQPKVINGASDLLGEVFGEAGRHARSAVGVAELPLGAPVEVELVVEVGRDRPVRSDRPPPTRSATSCCSGWPDGCPTSCSGGCATGWPREGRAALGATLPRELLRHRVGLTEHECELLAAAVGGWGASRRLLDAVLPVDRPDEPATDFRRGAGRGRPGGAERARPSSAATRAARSCARSAGAR